MSCDVVTSAETWCLPRNGYNYNHTTKYYCVPQSTRRKFRSQASDNMERWKAETRKVEERKGKSQKKEDTGAGNVGKVEKHAETLSFFRMICGSGGSKSRLLKAAAFSSQDAAKSICGLTGVYQVSEVRGIRKTWFYHCGHLTSTKWRKGCWAKLNTCVSPKFWASSQEHETTRWLFPRRSEFAFRYKWRQGLCPAVARLTHPPPKKELGSSISNSGLCQQQSFSAAFLAVFLSSFPQQSFSTVFLSHHLAVVRGWWPAIICGHLQTGSLKEPFAALFGKAALTGGAKQAGFQVKMQKKHDGFFEG